MPFLASQSHTRAFLNLSVTQVLLFNRMLLNPHPRVQLADTTLVSLTRAKQDWKDFTPALKNWAGMSSQKCADGPDLSTCVCVCV